MERKQLNLSAPLLSARRYSSPLRSSGEQQQKNDIVLDRRNTFPVSPQHPGKPDSNMGELMKPVSVPFNWEQTPGKAKGGNTESHSPEEPASTPPRLPPGRALGLLPWYSGIKSGELNGARSSTSGKLSGELGLIRPQHKLSGELNGTSTSRPYHYSATKFTSGELNGFRNLSKLPPGKTSVVGLRVDSWREGMNRAAGIDTVSDDLDDYDEDAEFSDVIGALESRSINCSISGVSGSECHSRKPSAELYALEVQSRDFMINRFLPAAKAMTLETPQYASCNKKQLVVVEQPPQQQQQQQCKALVPRLPMGPPRPPSEHNMALAITPYTGQDIGGGGSEEYSEADDEYENASYSQPRNIAVKACGFLPRFCAKNALKFFNPLPAMKTKTKNALSTAGKLVKNASHKSPSRKLTKHLTCTNDHKTKVNPTFKSCELNVPNIKSKPTFYSGELQAKNGLSPYRNYRRSNNTSPRRCESPQSVRHNAPKRVDSYTEDRSRHYHEKDSKKPEQQPPSRQGSIHYGLGSKSPVPEKTLFVDSENIAKIPQWSSISSKPRKLNDYSDPGNVYLKRENATANILKARGYSGPLACGAVETVRTGHQSSMTMISESKQRQQQQLGGGGDGILNMNRELILIEETNNQDQAVQSPLTPPLPKSPSESWLSRNLTSGSPRNSFSYANMNKYQPRKQNANTPPGAASAAVTKWENIVKSSHIRYDYGRYSEELVTHVSHPSRTRN